MTKEKQLAIDTIIDTCAGRTCLRQCIEHIRAADTPPHPTCCGGGGYSRARVLVLWVLAIFSLLILVCKLHAQEVSGVIVDINGVGTFVGGSVTVTGWGGGGGGDGEPTVVITNVLGVCTNCTDIPPEIVRNYGYEILGRCELLEYMAKAVINVYQGLYDDITDQRADIAKFKSYIATSSNSTVENQVYAALTNDAHQGVIGTQGDLVLSYTPVYSGTGVIRSRIVTAYANGIYDYAHSLDNGTLDYWQYVVGTSTDAVDTVYNESRSVRNTAENLLFARECTATPDYYVPTNSPSGGGSSGNDTACLEQLQTLTAIVDHIDNDMHRHLDTINTISNNVYKIEKNLDTYGRQVVDALFTHRETIPNQDDLQTYFSTTWQDVYLRGSPTDWGYNPTNVLERIELLLYGLSGVGTNSTDLTDAPETYESAANSLISQVEGITSDAAVHQTNVESLGQEIASFFSTFTSFAGRAMATNEQILPPVRVTLDGEQKEVPAFQLSSQDHGSLVIVFNNFAVFVRAVCVTLYLIAALVLLWFYWGWFCKWAVSFSKWACEILTSLFAS